MSYLDDDIAAAEARVAELKADRGRREAMQAERQAEMTATQLREHNRNEEAQRRAQQFADQFNNAPLDMYGTRMGISPRATEEFTNHRFITTLKERIRFWGELGNMSIEDIRR
jgi:hypothetical protein